MHLGIKKLDYLLPRNYKDVNELKLSKKKIKKIIEKTGIKKVFFTKKSLISNCEKLINNFFEKNNIKKSRIKFLILVTQSPDYILPSNSCVLQYKCNFNTDIITFDINQGCSGFIYGLAISNSIFKSNLADEGILICADRYSKFISNNNITCRVLFSDAFSLIYLKKKKKKTFLSFEFGTDGSGYKSLIVPNKELEKKNKIFKSNNLFMSGSEVFVFAIKRVPEIIKKILKKNSLTSNEIDYFLFHQASKLVIETLSEKMQIPKEKILNNFSEVGNTTSSSIPIILQKYQKKLKKKKILMVGFGVGFSWGASIINF